MGRLPIWKSPTQKNAHILIHNGCAQTGEGIYGAAFLLYDSGKNPIGEYVSDQDGYVYIDDDLENGRYYLREIKAGRRATLPTIP